jgi:anti-sigma B factor antagonist
MFEIEQGSDGYIKLSGRLDASQADKARSFLEQHSKSCTLDFSDLDYISSAGLGVLLGTQKRLGESGDMLRLINLSKHIKDIFLYAGFDHIFKIE